MAKAAGTAGAKGGDDAHIRISAFAPVRGRYRGPRLVETLPGLRSEEAAGACGTAVHDTARAGHARRAGARPADVPSPCSGRDGCPPQGPVGAGPAATPADWNRFQRKIVDFVVEDPTTGSLVALIEIDDRSHEPGKDRERDAMIRSDA
ncbi:DUF2726 domain-containing protein [Sphingobium scionense]